MGAHAYYNMRQVHHETTNYTGFKFCHLVTSPASHQLETKSKKATSWWSGEVKQAVRKKKDMYYYGLISGLGYITVRNIMLLSATYV